MGIAANLLKDIDRFLTRHKMPESNFGKEAFNDTAFVRRLRGGMNPRAKRIDECYSFMAKEERRREKAKAKEERAA